jgi:hypothetical protein
MGVKFGLYIMERTQTESVWEQGAKEKNWMKCEEVTGRRRKMNNENLHNFWSNQISLGWLNKGG